MVKRLLLVAAFWLSACAIANAACVTPITGNDAGGTSRTFLTILDGSSNCIGTSIIVDGTAGANKTAVKAASTAAVAADPALVVAVSPNNTVGVTQATAANLNATVVSTGTFTTQINGFTSWAGSTLGAMANYGTSPGAVLVPGVNAFVTNTPTVSVPTWAGGTLGAMANYGTSPGAVLVPGVNAFVTNANPNGQATMANSSPVVPASNWIGDPCWATNSKSGAAINLTASGQVITGTASKKTWICSIDIVSATAQNIALVEGTGTTCATNIFGLAGGTTAATGWNLAANGGLTKGSGVGTVISPSADANATAANVCLLLSGTGQTSGQITYVQQ